MSFVSHGCCCFADSFVEPGNQAEIAGDGGAEICKLLHNVKGEVVDGDAWDTADILAQYIGLL